MKNPGKPYSVNPFYLKSKLMLLLILFSLQFYYSGAQQQNKQLPVYECLKIDAEIKITGKADDALWKLAKEVKLAEAETGKPGRYNTTVKMLYNSKHLYIAFECADDSVWGTFNQRDAQIFSEECVEVFLCPSGKIRQYYELNISPLNTVFDAVIFNMKTLQQGGRLRSWTDFTCEGMTTKVNVTGEIGKAGAKRWSVEYAIPFTSIIGSDNLVPVAGEEWRMNLYRIDHPANSSLEYYAWSPPGKLDFHLPWKFGILKFIE